MPIKSFLLLFFAFAFLTLTVDAQNKKPIDHSVYDGWKDLKNPAISNDGKLVAYEINPQKGDGVLHLYNNASEEDQTFQRGYKPAFGSNSNFLVYKIKVQYDTVRAKKLKKVKKEDLPKDSIAIFIVDENRSITYPQLKDFQLPEKPSDWMAILLEMEKTKKQDSDSTHSEKEESKDKKKKKPEKEYSLVMLNPLTNDSVSFDRVSHYSLSKNGLTCAFIQVKKDSIDSVFVSVFNTKKMGINVIFEEPGYAESIEVSEQGDQLAFTYSSDTSEAKAYSVYYTGLKNNDPVLIPNSEIENTFPDWTASKHAKIYFNESGDELYFGNAPKPDPIVEDTLTEDEKVSLDIWNWKDPYLQPHQLKRLKKEQERSYQVVYFPKQNRAVQLGSEELEEVKIDVKASGKWIVGTTNKPYRKMLSWDGSRYNDVYLVDRETGERKHILEKVASTVSFSPRQNYVAWYNIADSSWHVYDVDTKTSKNISAALGVNFYNEWNDMPNEANAYGFGGWTEKENFIIYDRFDLWLIDPSGKENAKLLTKGAGRKNKLKFRYVKLDKEEQFLPETMLLSAFQEVNKQAGYYSLDLKKGKLEQLMLDDHYYKGLLKAKEADQLVWRRESFTEFPDLYQSGLDFSNPVKLSEANPQQADYNWGTSELVDWVTFNGDSLQGILVKPENFDPTKKYPMLVYFYERTSNRLNVYYTPKPIRSTINWTYYASNEYIIFIPDIIYRVGYPGPSAYDCIVSGTQAMINRFPFIDRDNLGIQGQSWGGYQTAYLVTQTDMYKAAMAGAVVSNMTSAYGGIRWGTGVSRAFQYEETQSRIGATLWERRDLYILNSPLFFADQVNTPLLMMHNDDDGAVPWYQGIEFFSALRRLDKPVWMLVYNKAPHNLKRRADMEDLTIRMQQFFDFYLKGAPEPVWMNSGVPAIEKGKSFGFELVK